MAESLPLDLADASVVIGHPSAQEDYTFALSLFVLQLRDDAAWRTTRPGPVSLAPIEADLLMAAHAPPDRWSDGTRLLEVACDVIRTTPRLESATSHSTAEVHLRPVTLNEITDVWRALGAPLQPSVLCTVRVSPMPVGHDLR
ncbi:MAG: DUF4255 domain-containing protein [Acidobacteriota bacterium]|nr:DUF4255 domain-containing protein [Acidobacteriota bacterium]